LGLAVLTRAGQGGAVCADRCDGHKAAEIVTRQLQNVADFPATMSILPANNPSANYYHMVMREHFETPAQRFYYGSQLPQFGDLRLPKGRGPHPVAIVIHGGAWGSSFPCTTRLRSLLH